VQRLKLALSERAPKTVNNVLTVLSTLLKKAVEWGEIERLPCVIKFLPNPKKTMGFHDFDHYERLLVVARKRGEDAYLAGGDAGLRLGRSLRLNGAISSSRRAVSPCSDPTGWGMSRYRRVAGLVSCR
jgi:hypothetical protein